MRIMWLQIGKVSLKLTYLRIFEKLRISVRQMSLQKRTLDATEKNFTPRLKMSES